MTSGRIITDDYQILRQELKNIKKIGIWGIHQNLHKGHYSVHSTIKEQSDFIVGVYYVNWGSLIKSFTGCIEFVDPPLNIDLLNKFHKLNDITFVMTEDIFNGQYDYTKSDLWPIILHQLPDKSIPDVLCTKPAKDILLSHLRTAQAMKIIFNGQIGRKCIISGGCVRDAWRWEFQKWYESEYPEHKYLLVEPVVDEYQNSYSSTRKNIIDKKLLLPKFKNKEDVSKHTKINCLYFFKLNGYTYAGFEKNGIVFIDGSKL